VSHHSSREHRVLTKFRHLTRFLASALISFHVLLWSLISSRIVLRHAIRGLPRDLVPWGFHSKAAFAMSPGGRRSVWQHRITYSKNKALQTTQHASSRPLSLTAKIAPPPHSHPLWTIIKLSNILAHIFLFIDLLSATELKHPTAKHRRCAKPSTNKP
jgi:hypothetical protein